MNSRALENTEGEVADRRFKRGLLVVVGIVWLFSAGAAMLYVWKFGSLGLSPDQGEWGEMGDFLGGVINPMIGIATVGLLAWSMTIQREELRASVAELKDSNRYASRIGFEQALFSWLQNYHEQVRAIRLRDHQGREALDNLFQNRLTLHGVLPYGEQMSDIEGPSIGFVSDAVKAYLDAYDEMRSSLDAPFRTLYRLFRWVDETSLSNIEKWHYCALIRAQLSHAEMAVLYYNGITHLGAKFAMLANKYALFDNLWDTDRLIQFAIDHYNQHPEKAIEPLADGGGQWRYRYSAFDSESAKEALGVDVSI